MIDPAEAKQTYRAASAIGAFDAIQVAFAALVKKGILSKAEAEQILMQAIETIRPAAPMIKPSPYCRVAGSNLELFSKAMARASTGILVTPAIATVIS
jgi:hypothetical protein